MLKKILRIDLIKNVSFLTLGTIFSLAISFLCEPLLKSIYEPEDFGKLNLFLKFFSTLTILFSGCYEMAIIIADDDEAKNIVNGNIILNIIFTIFFEVVFFILIYFDFLDKNYKLILFLPPTVMIYSIGLSYNNYLIKKEKYNKVSINKLIRKFGETSSQIILKYILGYLGLVIGSLVGNFFYMFYNFKVSDLKIQIELKKVKEVWKKYIEFPKYYLVPQLYNTFSFSILDFTIFAKFSLREVGYLELTNKFLSLPSTLLGESIGKVLLQSASKKINEKKSIKKEVIYILIFLLLVGFVFYISIFYFGIIIFKIIFGIKWIKSGIYAKYLIGYISFSFIVRTLSNLLIPLNKIKRNSIWQTIKTTSILSLCFFKFNSTEVFIKIYSSINVILYFIYFILIIREVYSYERKINENKHIKVQ